MSGAEFQYPDLTWKKTCGQMANLVANTGGNKGQLSLLVEAICRDFRAAYPDLTQTFPHQPQSLTVVVRRLSRQL